MQENIFRLLLFILLLENNGESDKINETIILSLLLMTRDRTSCCTNDDYTF